jgi:hypothetical protein
LDSEKRHQHTGMPSFALADVKDDESGRLSLPEEVAGVSEADYKAWTAAP